jgi:uncharacterized protein with GYD domain
MVRLATYIAVFVLAHYASAGAKTINLPKQPLTEAVATAGHFLEAQKIDVSRHVLLSAEFKNLFNEYESAFWEITWVLGDKHVVVHVFQDGSCKLLPTL